MTVASSTRWSPRQRGAARSHRGWAMYASAGLAWAVLLGWAFAEGRPAHPVGHMTVPDMPEMAGSVDHGHGGPTWIAHWLVMVIAMMLPLYATPTSALARSVFRRWRAAVVATYLVTLLAMWVGVGYAIRLVYLVAAPAIPAWAWSAGWLVVAIAAMQSVWRARLLRACQLPATIPPLGRRALIAAALSALRAWPRCAALCGPVMIAMTAGHPLLLMIGATAAVWWEQRHPRTWRDPVPVAILTLSLVAITAISLTEGIPPWLMPLLASH